MPIRVEVVLVAPGDAVRAAAREEFGAADEFLVASPDHDDIAVRLDVATVDGNSTAVLTTEAPPPLPYFHWFMGPITRRILRRTLVHARDRLLARLDGEPPPPPPKRNLLAPPVTFGPDEGAVIATVAAITLVAGFGSTLFSANVDFITEGFDQTERAVGIGSAVTRVGVLVGLVAAAMADRLGRRRAVLVTAAGVCIASGLSALAPTFEAFVGFQLLSRGCFNAVFVISAIIAVEEAPERGRAYALAMVTLAWGAGEAIGVVLLPLGDVGDQAWRFAYAANAVMIFAIPGFARRLPETTRYRHAADQLLPRGRLRDLTVRRYRGRFALVLGAALLLNVMAAPSSQFSNRFLADERGFSGLEIALFLAVVGGLPGLIGLFAGGRLSDTVGRRPVSIWGTAVGTVTTMAFYVGSGAALWFLGTIDAFAVAVTVPAVRAFGVELFPTQVRGTASAALLVTGVIGSAAGLVIVGVLSDHMSLGGAIALMGVGPLVAGLILLPLLPEPSGKDLDVISPPLA